MTTKQITASLKDRLSFLRDQRRLTPYHQDHATLDTQIDALKNKIAELGKPKSTIVKLAREIKKGDVFPAYMDEPEKTVLTASVRFVGKRESSELETQDATGKKAWSYMSPVANVTIFA